MALIAAVSMLGVVVPSAAFAQVGPQININNNIAPTIQACPSVALFGSTATSNCAASTSQGACQQNVGVDRQFFGTVSTTFVAGDCS